MRIVQHGTDSPAEMQDKYPDSMMNNGKKMNEIQTLKQKCDELNNIAAEYSERIEDTTQKLHAQQEEVRKFDETLSALKSRIVSLSESKDEQEQDISVLVKLFETANDKRHQTASAISMLYSTIENNKAELFKTEMELFAVHQQIKNIME